MKDNEKKALLFVGIVSVIALPYFFYSKQAKIDTETIKAEVDTLQARYDQLLEMNENREFYLAETERYNKERDEIIALFPSDIDQAKYTMFLLNTEYSSIQKNEETGEYEWVYPFRFDSVGYGDNLATEISGEEAETDYVAIANLSTLTYRTYYDGMKYMLDYLMEYEDPMIYKGFTAEFDQTTGIIQGTIQLAQYAVQGGDRPFVPVSFESNFNGYEYSFDIDNYGLIGGDWPLIEFRGNEEVGIFGPIDNPVLEEEEEGETDAAPAEDTADDADDAAEE